MWLKARQLVCWADIRVPYPLGPASCGGGLCSEAVPQCFCGYQQGFIVWYYFRRIQARRGVPMCQVQCALHCGKYGQPSGVAVTLATKGHGNANTTSDVCGPVWERVRSSWHPGFAYNPHSHILRGAHARPTCVLNQRCVLMCAPRAVAGGHGSTGHGIRTPWAFSMPHLDHRSILLFGIVGQHHFVGFGVG